MGCDEHSLNRKEKAEAMYNRAEVEKCSWQCRACDYDDNSESRY